MSHDLAATVCTGRCERVDGALEAVKDMGLIPHAHFETFIIGVAADLTGRVLFTQHVFTFIHIYLFSNHG
jgi:hypothetical protein